MQRRAAAVYFILFVLVGAGAYGFLQVGMAKPTAELGGPTFSAGDELTVDGQTYTVAGMEVEANGEPTAYGGSVELTRFNESARGTATLENGSTVAYDGGQYLVRTQNASGTFRLIEQQDVDAILASDPAVANETVTRDGEEYVVFEQNQTLRPLAEYLPAADTAEFGTGGQFAYQPENVTAQIEGVTQSSVALSWAAPGEESIEISQGTNTTVNGVDHFAHFTSENQVQILESTEYYDEYTAEVETIRYWDERRNGVWGIVILSLIAGVVLLSTAYLPVRG